MNKDNCKHYFPRNEKWSGSIIGDWYFLPCSKCGTGEEYWYKMASRKHEDCECLDKVLTQCIEKTAGVVHQGGAANDEEVWGRVVKIIEMKSK